MSEGTVEAAKRSLGRLRDAGKIRFENGCAELLDPGGQVDTP
jgi:hypothetical protein